VQHPPAKYTNRLNKTSLYLIGVSVALAAVVITLWRIGLARETQSFHKKVEAPVVSDSGVIHHRQIIETTTVDRPAKYSTLALALGMIFGCGAIATGAVGLLQMFPETPKEKREKAMAKIVRHIKANHLNNPLSGIYVSLQELKASLGSVSPNKDVPIDDDVVRLYVETQLSSNLWILEDNVPGDLLAEVLAPAQVISSAATANSTVEQEQMGQAQIGQEQMSKQPPRINQPASAQTCQPPIAHSPAQAPSPSPPIQFAPRTPAPEVPWETKMGNQIASYLNQHVLKEADNSVSFAGRVVESALAWRFIFNKGRGFKLPKEVPNLEIHFSTFAQPISGVSIGLTQEDGVFYVYVDLIRPEPIKIDLADALNISRGEVATTAFPIGELTDGNQLVYDFAEEGNNVLFIVGSPGSGKTVLIQTILHSIAATNHPNLFQVALFDPKSMLYFNEEFSSGWFPWLRWPVQNVMADTEAFNQPASADSPSATTDVNTSIEVFREIEREANRRGELLGNQVNNDIKKHNASHPPEDRIPYLLVILDEYNISKTSLAKKGFDIEAWMQDIILRGRSLGIFLVLGGQDYNSEEMQIQSIRRHCRRIALKMNDVTGSRQFVGSPVARDLLGRGHGVFQNGSDLAHFQSYNSGGVDFLSRCLNIPVPQSILNAVNT